MDLGFFMCLGFDEIIKRNTVVVNIRKPHLKRRSLLSDRGISSKDAVLGKHDLPELIASGAEGSGAGKEIIRPHSEKPIIVAGSERFPVRDDILVPCDERLVIVRAEVVPVLHDKDSFRGAGDLLDRGKHAVRKNIFFDPRFVCDGRTFTANRMQ